MALGVALFKSVQDYYLKRYCQKQSPYFLSAGFNLIAVPVLLVLLFIKGIPNINNGFYWSAFVAYAINAFTIILYIRALQISPLGVTIPMLAFTPAFLLLASPLILGEFPNSYGLAGILLIFAGSYVLNINLRKYGILYPIKKLWDDKGSRYMLLIAFLFSISSSTEKIAVRSSSPEFYLLLWFLFVGITAFISGIVKEPEKRTILHKETPLLFVIGMITLLFMYLHVNVIQMNIVVYAISIKRLSIFFSVIIGMVIFREKHGKEHLLGSLLMVLGTILIGLFG